MSLFEKSEWPQRATEEKQILPWLPYFVMAISRQQKRATEVFFSVVLRFSQRFSVGKFKSDSYRMGHYQKSNSINL
jgi:hypothetical protein